MEEKEDTMNDSDIMTSDDTVDFDEDSIVEANQTQTVPTPGGLSITLQVGSSTHSGKLMFSRTQAHGSGFGFTRVIRASFDPSLYSELSKAPMNISLHYSIADMQNNNTICSREISVLRSWAYYAENNEFEFQF